MKLSGSWQLDRNELAVKDRSECCLFRAFIFMTQQELPKHNNKSNNKRLKLLELDLKKKTNEEESTADGWDAHHTADRGLQFRS